MKKFFKEFKDFISRGSVLELAVGMIIGAAFNKIVSSMVNDLLMPVISLVFKGDINDVFFILRGTAQWIPNADTGALELVKSADAVLLFHGRFLQSIFDFVIIAMTLFIIIKVANRLSQRNKARMQKIKDKIAAGEELTEEEAKHAPEPEPEPVPSEEVVLLREIRDALAKK